MSYNELNIFLDHANIPVAKQKVGFLEIIGKQHHENINSALYAHFLSCGNTELQTLFLDSLLYLIHEKTDKKLSFSNCKVSTEAITPKGRIDILIEDYYNQTAIIIENKIYHYLDNDLVDYWQFSRFNEDNKVGVLLTLYPHEIPEEVSDKFINIIHIDWINQVKEQYYNTDLSLEGNYKIYLEDFINTIENLTKMNTMNESVKFYFQNATQVIKANETLKEAHLYMNNQLELVANKIGWQTFGSDLNWRNFWDEENHLDTYLTIVTENIVKGNGFNFMLILELNREDKGKEREIINKFKEHIQFKDKSRGEVKGKYVHFLCKNYDITFEELENFSDVVVQKIRQDFAEITVDIITYLYPSKDISKWKTQFLGKE
jgi:hypothetical protein